MREFLSFKSGKIYFNEQYDQSQIDCLLIRATILTETIVDLPILPELASRIQPDIMYSSISGTAAIEGNPITGDDVKKIAMGEDLEIYTKKDQQEIKNLIKAYNLLSSIEYSPEPFNLTEELIFQLHKIITTDVPDENNVPGKYRNGIVYVGDKAHGGVYTPPKIIEDIKNLMREFVDWINSNEVLHISPFVRASLAHYYFCIIHPFWDGNGRTARLIEAIILQSSNIKYVPRELSNYYYRNVDEYYNSFSKGIRLKKDATPFLKFCLEASIDSLTRIKETIVYFIRKFSLRDFYRFEKQNKIITTRQFELLSLLLDNPAEFPMKELKTTMPFSILYSKVTTQTARRDLKNLISKKLLLVDENNKHSLNFRVIG
jgi:Fic family protein